MKDIEDVRHVFISLLKSMAKGRGLSPIARHNPAPTLTQYMAKKVPVPPAFDSMTYQVQPNSAASYTKR